MYNQKRLLTEKSRLLTEKSRLLTEKSKLLTEKSRLLTEKSRLLTEKSRLLTEKSRLLTNLLVKWYLGWTLMTYNGGGDKKSVIIYFSEILSMISLVAL